MTTTLDKLKQTLTRVASIEAVQRSKQNCYAENVNGITALRLISSTITELVLDDSAKAVTHLYLGENPKLQQVSFKIPLPNLEILYLNNCALTALDMPHTCIRLEQIYAQGNTLGAFSFQGNFPALTLMDISSNQITDLLPLLPFLKLIKQEVEVNYYNNPFISPPKEIVEKGDEAVISYLESLQEASANQLEFVPINEIKIILVGEGMAGKTSLLKQIKGLKFNKNESQTHGVIIEKLPLDALKLFKNFAILRGVTGRFWDFGGQEIMHASHQFFLSNRSIYILVLDSRTDAKKEEWLKHVEKFGGNSPAIIAINKIDENPNYDVERRTLNAKFDFIGNRFHRISCDKGTGLEEFAQELADLIPQTEIFKTPFNPNWLAVKEQLESETAAKKYIDQQRFEAICVENSVTDKTAQNTLLGYLDSLGIALHFEELQLQDFYVLDPHWVTIGVYKIINSQAIEKGLFKESMLDYILNKEEVKKEEYDPAKDKKITYSAPEQAYLIKIMQQFELLYEYKKGQYLVPDLLPKEPQAAFSIDHTEADHIHFVMTYDFLPPSVMSRFIIRMKNDIHNLDHLWRYGVELKNNKTKAIAIVKANKVEKRIDICVSGDAKSKRDYFAVIHHALQEINDSFTIKGSNDKVKSLIVKEFMPVPEHPDILVDFEDLIGFEKAGKTTYYVGRLKKDFSVSEDFLDKISTKEQRQRGHLEDFHRFERELYTLPKPIVETPISQPINPTPQPTTMKGINKNLIIGGIIAIAILLLPIWNTQTGRVSILGLIEIAIGPKTEPKPQEPVKESPKKVFIKGYLKFNNTQVATKKDIAYVKINLNGVNSEELDDEGSFTFKVDPKKLEKEVKVEAFFADRSSLVTASKFIEDPDKDSYIYLPNLSVNKNPAYKPSPSSKMSDRFIIQVNVGDNNKNSIERK